MKLAKIKGIQIIIHFSTLLIVLMVGYIVSSFYYQLTLGMAPLWQLIIIGIINGLIILFSIIIHELIHSLTALKFGLPISEIELYLFGGVSKIEEEPKSPKEEALITFVGPLSSLLLGGFFFLLMFIMGDTFNEFLYPNFYSTFINFNKGLFNPARLILDATIFYSAWSNLILGAFNLLPAFPMDGGRLLRALIWKIRKDHISATETASKVGQVFGFLFIGFGFLEIFFFGLINGIWLIIIGSFLRSSAQSAYLQTILQVKLSKITAGELLHEFELIIPQDMSLENLINNYFIKYKKGYFPVGIDGKIIGIIHFTDIKNVNVEESHLKNAKSIMRDIDEFPSIDYNKSGLEVWKKINQITTHPKIVIVRGRENNIIGYIGEEELAFILRFS